MVRALLRFLLMRIFLRGAAIFLFVFGYLAYWGYKYGTQPNFNWDFVLPILYIVLSLVFPLAIYKLGGWFFVDSSMEFEASRPVAREQLFDISAAIAMVFGCLAFGTLIASYAVGLSARLEHAATGTEISIWDEALSILPVGTLIIATAILTSVLTFCCGGQHEQAQAHANQIGLQPFGVTGVSYFGIGVALLLFRSLGAPDTLNLATLGILLLPLSLYFLVRGYVKRGLLLQ